MSWLSICSSCPPVASFDLLSVLLGFGVCTPPGPSESKKRFLRSEGRDAWAGAGRASFSLRSYHYSDQYSLCLLLETYLYTGVLRSEVDCAVVGRVCDAENVSDVVGGPQCVETLKGRCTPDLCRQPELPINDAAGHTLTMGSVALENNSFWSCDRQNPRTLPLWAWMTLRRSYVSRL